MFGKFKNKKILYRNFTNEDPMVIMHLAGKEIIDLKKYIEVSNNKDLARKFIIDTKYRISKLKPLMYTVLINHCGRFTQNVSKIMAGTWDDKKVYYRMTINNYILYIEAIPIMSTQTPPILFKIDDANPSEDDYQKLSYMIKRGGHDLNGFNILTEEKTNSILLRTIGEYQDETKTKLAEFKEARRKDQLIQTRNKIMNMDFADEN